MNLTDAMAAKAEGNTVDVSSFADADGAADTGEGVTQRSSQDSADDVPKVSLG